ncbi:MAG TPA: hypothetical protein VN258_08405 [Mobilitalea sp.]|nr:hypothetical protein [Mobilitalea sp.]
MNLPFGLPVIRENVVRKREESSETAEHYDHKLAKLRETLEYYRKCLFEYANKLDSYDRKSLDSQHAMVQSALDMTYIKEQGDKTLEEIQSIKNDPLNKTLSNLDVIAVAMSDMNDKMVSLDRLMETLDKNIGMVDKDVEALDKNVVNRLSEFLLELQKQTIHQNMQLQTDVMTGIEKLHRSVKKGHALLWFILLFNLFGIGTMIFFVLYYLEIIPF